MHSHCHRAGIIWTRRFQSQSSALINAGIHTSTVTRMCFDEQVSDGLARAMLLTNLAAARIYCAASGIPALASVIASVEFRTVSHFVSGRWSLFNVSDCVLIVLHQSISFVFIKQMFFSQICTRSGRPTTFWLPSCIAIVSHHIHETNVIWGAGAEGGWIIHVYSRIVHDDAQIL